MDRGKERGNGRDAASGDTSRGATAWIAARPETRRDGSASGFRRGSSPGAGGDAASMTAGWKQIKGEEEGGVG